MKLITNFGLFIFTFLTCISLFNTKSVMGRTPYPLEYCNVHGNQGWTSYLLLQYEFVPPNPQIWVLKKMLGAQLAPILAREAK